MRKNMKLVVAYRPAPRPGTDPKMVYQVVSCENTTEFEPGSWMSKTRWTTSSSGRRGP
jgi:hypothetical protein